MTESDRFGAILGVGLIDLQRHSLSTAPKNIDKTLDICLTDELDQLTINLVQDLQCAGQRGGLHPGRSKIR